MRNHCFIFEELSSHHAMSESERNEQSGATEIRLFVQSEASVGIFGGSGFTFNCSTTCKNARSAIYSKVIAHGP